MLLPPWLLLTTKLKGLLWLVNRLATWTGLYYLWKRLKGRRFAWLWIVLINLFSVALLGVLFWYLYTKGHAPAIHAE